MHVLTVTTIFPGSATPNAGVFIKERQRHLPADVQVTVLRLRPWFPLVDRFRNPRAAPIAAVETVDGLEVHDARFFYIPRFDKASDGERFGRALGRWLAAWTGPPFDLIDAHFTFPAGHGAILAGKAHGLPVVVTERGTLPAYSTDGRVQRMRDTLHAAAALVSVSESLAVAMRAVAGQDLKIAVIPNGVDATLFRPGDRAAARRRLGMASDARLLLTVGGLVPRKGVARVLEALPELAARLPSVVYAVIGSGGVEGDHGRRLRQRIGELGIGDRVKMVGAVAHRDLADWYVAADLFVLATSNEGWANVLQESLACGTPCITTDVGGNREVVPRDELGTVVPFGDAAALRQAIMVGLERTWDHESIAAFGRRRTWQAVGRDVKSVYEEVLNARR